MIVQEKATLAFKGKTITIPSTPGGVLSRKECRILLGIKSYHTIDAYVKALLLDEQDYFSWDDFKEILGLQMFLRLGHGQNSKRQYVYLRDHGHLKKIFRSFGIDFDVEIETKFRQLQADYWKRKAATQKA